MSGSWHRDGRWYRYGRDPLNKSYVAPMAHVLMQARYADLQMYAMQWAMLLYHRMGDHPHVDDLTAAVRWCCPETLAVPYENVRAAVKVATWGFRYGRPAHLEIL